MNLDEMGRIVRQAVGRYRFEVEEDKEEGVVRVIVYGVPEDKREDVEDRIYQIEDKLIDEWSGYILVAEVTSEEE